MSKICPKCGNELSDDSHFCNDCGYNFQANSSNSESLSNLSTYGKIFIVLIAFLVIIGAVFVFNMGMSSNNHANDATNYDDVEHVDLTITEVSGYSDDDDNNTSYSLMTSALFTRLPSSYDGYIIKTSYYDKNGTVIDQVTESLSSVIYDDDTGTYPFSFAFTYFYKKPNPDHVTVEIIKGGKTVDNFTYEIDENDIDYLD